MPNPPQKTKLPETLALRVQHLRNLLNLTPKSLAQKAQVPLELVEDVEAGLVTFLSPAVRQKLARALRSKSDILAEVENKQDSPKKASPILRKQILDAIIRSPYDTHICPECNAKLQIQYFERRDLEDNPLIAIKINCSKCLFRVETN